MGSLARVVITGSQGSLGKIVQEGIRGSFNLLCIDRISESADVVALDIAAEYKKLTHLLRINDMILHLAWNTLEDYPNENISPQNKAMAENVYRAAVEKKISRIVIASSVHAHDYSAVPFGEYIDPQSENCPDTPYGATKIYIESLGRYFSMKYGLEVICLRLGGVNEGNEIRFNEDPLYDKVLLYKEDFLDLVRMCINARKVPNRFAVLNAVSNVPGRVHAINNFLNWYPKFPENEK